MTEFNLDGEVHAMPGCYHGKYLFLLVFTAFGGASKGLPGHVPGVITTEQYGEVEAAIAAHEQGYGVQAAL